MRSSSRESAARPSALQRRGRKRREPLAARTRQARRLLPRHRLDLRAHDLQHLDWYTQLGAAVGARVRRTIVAEEPAQLRALRAGEGWQGEGGRLAQN